MEAVAATAAATVVAAVLIFLVAAEVRFAPKLVLLDALVVAVDPRMGICLSLSLIISTQEGVGLQ